MSDPHQRRQLAPDRLTPETDPPPPRGLYASMRTADLRQLLAAFVLDAHAVTNPRSRAFIDGRIAAIREELARRKTYADTPEETRVLELYRAIPPEDRRLIVAFLEKLTQPRRKTDAP
jgi:hypothetical protein